MQIPRVTLVAHTHWDREWYLPFEVFRAHLLEVMDEALELLEHDRRLSFTLDGQTMLVDDYLELRPQAEPRVRALVQAGQLHVGPWFTQADTLLSDGEALIRNLALGVRRAEELGGVMRIGYMPDQFGHAAQLPQILRLFGIDSAVLWRGVGPQRPPPAFTWVGPDGSAVLSLWLQDGYATGRLIPSDPAGFAAAIERSIERLGPWLGELPLLVPIGDDHVRLSAWLPDAAEHLRKIQPALPVTVGSYAHHLSFVRAALPSLTPALQVVTGELRSPAFAPVLAGVTSARVREKQAAARAETLLLRYAEPLSAWSGWSAAGPAATAPLLRRAWRQVLLNQAHDSAAGCGVDATHKDVRARYRWSEQITTTLRDQILSSLQVLAPDGSPAQLAAYCPGPGATALFEAEVPRTELYGGPLYSQGPDGALRPVQLLDAAPEERPLFEGEFGAAELGVFIQGTDPATPLFGKYLTGIAVHPDGPGRLRLDVALGDEPVQRGALAADQRRVLGLLNDAARFRIVIHNRSTQARILVQAGPAPQMGFLPVALRPAAPGEVIPGPGPGADAARALDADGALSIAAGPVVVTAQLDGTVLIADHSLDLPPVLANDLVDEGDRGDLYHFEPVAGDAWLRSRAARIQVTESGPLRARLRIEQELPLPIGLTEDRAGRAAPKRATRVTTEITVQAGERRVEFVTTLDNQVRDHRLRALCHLPLRPDRLDVGHGLAVTGRPLDPLSLGSGVERPAPTGPHHGFVDVSDGARGVALMSRGLPEHELLQAPGSGPVLALTLLRGVGWLARGDLSAMDHAAGPILPTPDAQELGPHRFEYAVRLHAGDWAAGLLLADSARYQAPAIAVPQRGRRLVPGGLALCEVGPACVQLSAAYPSEPGHGLVVRVVNASARPVLSRLRPARKAHEALLVDPLERPVNPPLVELRFDGETAEVPLGPWQIATVLFQ